MLLFVDPFFPIASVCSLPKEGAPLRSRKNSFESGSVFLLGVDIVYLVVQIVVLNVDCCMEAADDCPEYDQVATSMVLLKYASLEALEVSVTASSISHSTRYQSRR